MQQSLKRRLQNAMRQFPGARNMLDFGAGGAMRPARHAAGRRSHVVAQNLLMHLASRSDAESLY